MASGGEIRYMDCMTQVTWALIATAATVSIVDCIPGDSKLKLKDLSTPKEELASHSEVFKLLFSTKLDN